MGKRKEKTEEYMCLNGMMTSDFEVYAQSYREPAQRICRHFGSGWFLRGFDPGMTIGNSWEYLKLSATVASILNNAFMELERLENRHADQLMQEHVQKYHAS